MLHSDKCTHACLQVVGSSYQALEVPNPATYIGGGKVMQVAQAVQAYNIETVIFDDGELCSAMLMVAFTCRDT